MKYCISGRQQASVLKLADEIKMQYKDRDRLINYVEDYMDKSFILQIPKGAEVFEWDLWKAYSERVDFCLAIEDLGIAAECKEQGIRFYWDYPCFSWYELDSILKLEPCQVLLEAPLSFDLIKVRQKTQLPLRLFANMANEGYIPKETGLYGTFVRPEDVKTYDNWITTLEFKSDRLSEEETLLKVYQAQDWPGNLNLLFPKLNINVDNRAIPDEFAVTRANCGQRCMINNNRCGFCSTALRFAEALRKEHYRRLKESQQS